MAGMKALLVFCHVEAPVAIEVPAQVMALRWTITSAISSVQRIPERSIRSFMRFLHAPSTGPLAMGQPLARYSS